MYNILIVDDEKDIVQALKIYLSSESQYRTFTAFTGKQALDILETGRNSSGADGHNDAGDGRDLGTFRAA